MRYFVADIELFDIVPGYHARFIHRETMTLAYVDVDEGAELPDPGCIQSGAGGFPE